MYIKLTNPKKDGNKIYDNTGPVDLLVEYLKHEAKEKGEQEAIFFNHSEENMADDAVKRRVNQNVKGVKEHEEKFYSVIINLSEAELSHIRNEDALLKQYVRQVMENYASAFKLKDGQQLHSKNLVWFATIHNDREVRSIDLQNSELLGGKEQSSKETLRVSPNANANQQREMERMIKWAEVRDEKGSAAQRIVSPSGYCTTGAAQRNAAQKSDREVFKVGDKKPGLNKHVHVIVSRRDQSQNITLNPRTRQGRFHIRGFQEKSARDFQHMFQYGKETLCEGFYKKYDEKDQAQFDRKIEAATDQMNQHLGEEKIDPERLKKIGQECQYSRAFFVNLTKLKYRFIRGEYVHDPYFFAQRGREQKESEYYRTLDHKYFSEGLEDGKAGNRQALDRTSGKAEGVAAGQLLSLLNSANSGPLMMKETLMLDEERNKLHKYKERGRDDNKTEMDSL